MEDFSPGLLLSWKLRDLRLPVGLSMDNIGKDARIENVSLWPKAFHTNSMAT